MKRPPKVVKKKKKSVKHIKRLTLLICKEFLQISKNKTDTQKENGSTLKPVHDE